MSIDFLQSLALIILSLSLIVCGITVSILRQQNEELKQKIEGLLKETGILRAEAKELMRQVHLYGLRRTSDYFRSNFK